MIDTGCTNTSIPYNVVKFLDLVPSGYQKMNAVNKSYVCNFYICNMIIEDQIQLNDVMVVGLPQLESEDETETPTANEQMILGMDILSKCGLNAILQLQTKTMEQNLPSLILPNAVLILQKNNRRTAPAVDLPVINMIAGF